MPNNKTYEAYLKLYVISENQQKTEIAIINKHYLENMKRLEIKLT